jgi:ElaB/YqjD/DUF883 family membrane-anchored ribosome-binding protein
MASSFETTAHSAANKISDTASAAADDISDVANRLQGRANEQIDRLSHTIRTKPLQSAAIAAGVGFLFAVIARR